MLSGVAAGAGSLALSRRKEDDTKAASAAAKIPWARGIADPRPSLRIDEALYQLDHVGLTVTPHPNNPPQTEKEMAMKFSHKAVLMILTAAILGFVFVTSPASAQSRPCAEDFKKFCPGVQRGDAAKCLKEHEAQLSTSCKDNMQAAQQRTQDIRQVCQSDVAKLCSGVSPGAPLMQCLRQHTSELSPDCKAALPQGRQTR